MSRGTVLEANLALPGRGESPDRWPAFVLESDGVDVNSTLVAIDSAARAIVANISSATRPVQPAVIHSWDHEIPLKPTQASVQVRLLYRLGMLELYVEDFLLV
eukprot:4156927-Prymnesium_polylepis.1